MKAIGRRILLRAQSEDKAVTDSQQEYGLETDLARSYTNLGNAFYDLGNPGQAQVCYQKATQIDPGFAEARNNLGMALVRLNQLDEALASYREAVRLKTDYTDAYYNLGFLFINRAQWDDAVAVLQQAVRLQPDHADAYALLAYALCELARAEEAAHCFQEVVRLKPNCADAHWGLTYIRLLQGDFDKAWPEYESWCRLKQRPVGESDQPCWNGSSFVGRTILLKAGGGLGDTLQFVRYAPIVKQYGGTVIVESQEPLLPLLATCAGIDQLVAVGSNIPAFDVLAPLVCLPGIMRTSLSTVPASVPYLFADAELEAKWRSELNRFTGFKIGIAWQGNLKYPRDHSRSIPLLNYAPLARIDGACLFSLQKGFGSEQLSAVADHFHVVDLGGRPDNRSDAVSDTAAIMKALDLVITSDTSIAHLAGALGVPVWVALPFSADWRWMLGREDSPWYPTMRLFRQSKPGDWAGVFERMARELSKKMAKGPETRSAAVEFEPGKLIDKVAAL
jgi:Flp pilus assembly protein TadD